MRKHAHLWAYFISGLAAFFSYNAFLAGYFAVGFFNAALAVITLYIGLEDPTDGAV